MKKTWFAVILSAFVVTSVFGQGHVTINDVKPDVTIAIGNSNGNPVGVDAATRTLQTVTYEHHEVHAGNHYHLSLSDTDLDSGETNGIVVITPNTTKWAHFVFEANNTVSSDFIVYEGAVQTNLGTQLTFFNSNRNSTNEAATTAYLFTNTSVTNLGTQISERLIGSASPQSKTGGSDRGANEMILKQNTTYCILLVGQADNGRANIGIYGYEHTSKTD